jgi:hypothetical protein
MSSVAVTSTVPSKSASNVPPASSQVTATVISAPVLAAPADGAGARPEKGGLSVVSQATRQQGPTSWQHQAGSIDLGNLQGQDSQNPGKDDHGAPPGPGAPNQSAPEPSGPDQAAPNHGAGATIQPPPFLPIGPPPSPVGSPLRPVGPPPHPVGSPLHPVGPPPHPVGSPDHFTGPPHSLRPH